MGIDFGVIWVADFNIAIRFYVRRRQKDTRRRLYDTRRPKDTRRHTIIK